MKPPQNLAMGLSFQRIVFGIAIALLACACTLLTGLDPLKGDGSDDASVGPDADTDADGGDASAADSSVDSSVDAADAAYVPTPGLYIYEQIGDGGDTIYAGDAFVPTPAYGQNVCARVVAEDGGWSFIVKYSSAHTATYPMVASGSTLGARGFSESVLVANVVVTCTPPNTIDYISNGPVNGKITCGGTDVVGPNSYLFSESMAWTHVGSEPISIGDASYNGFHVFVDASVSGLQEGQQKFDWWFRALRGIPLKLSIRTSVKMTPLNATYDQSVTLQLRNVSPVADAGGVPCP